MGDLGDQVSIPFVRRPPTFSARGTRGWKSGGGEPVAPTAAGGLHNPHCRRSLSNWQQAENLLPSLADEAGIVDSSGVPDWYFRPEITEQGDESDEQERLQIPGGYRG
jgi:hypothetical protein